MKTANNNVINTAPFSSDYKKNHRLTDEEINLCLDKLIKQTRRKEIKPEVVKKTIEYLFSMGYDVDKRYREERDEEELNVIREVSNAMKKNYRYEFNNSDGGNESELLNLVTRGEDLGFSLKTA